MKIILLVYILFYTIAGNAQLSYNGDFEYIGSDKKTSKWFYQLSENYNVIIDSSSAFKGKKSLRVSSTENATGYSSYTIFQTISLADFKNIKSIKVIYHTKIKRGNKQLFKPFVSPQQCSRKRSSKIAINWNDNQSGDWQSVEAEIKDSLSCEDIFIGFVVTGIVDLNVDDIEIFINDNKINDLPVKLVPPVVPEAKEIEWLKNNITGISSATDFQDLKDLSFLRKTIGAAKVVALGESTHGTKEFNTLRGRIIKYLVDSLNFQMIVFENNIIPTHYVNELLESSLDSKAILDSLFGRIHQTEEIAEIFDYIRTKNKQKRKAIIEGCDMQGYSYEAKSLLSFFKVKNTVLYYSLKKLKTIVLLLSGVLKNLTHYIKR